MKNQGRLPFEYEIDDGGPLVTAFGGLPLVAEALAKFGVDEALLQKLPDKAKRAFNAADLVRCVVMTLAAGGDCIEDVERLRLDEALCELLGQPLPSSSSVRQFLYSFHDEEIERSRPADESFVAPESERLAALGEVANTLVKGIAASFPEKVATLDVDATIIESHKREALAHYLNGRGYQPTFALWKEAGLIVHEHFRDGNVPAFKAISAFVQESFARLPSGIDKRYLRSDSAGYQEDLIKWLLANGIDFAIGARMHKELTAAVEAVSESEWHIVQERPDTTVAAAELSWKPKYLRDEKVRFIGIRMQPRQLELDSNRRTIHLAIITTRLELSTVEALKWYWEKAGTIEDAHDCLKNELGGGVLPCGRFGANAAWMRIVAMTYNVLRAIRRVGPKSLRDARPKRLRYALFSLPAVVTRHARRLVARLRELSDFALDLLATRQALSTA